MKGVNPKQIKHSIYFVIFSGGAYEIIIISSVTIGTVIVIIQ